MKATIHCSTILFTLIPFFSIGQELDHKNQTLGQYILSQEIDKRIEKEKTTSLIDTLLKTKEDAIEYAEPILFNAFGKSQVLNEKPYTTVFDKGIWVIKGTLKRKKGGTFLITLNAKDGKVIKLTHGK